MGGRLGRSSLSLQSHHAHRAAALPWHGSTSRGTRRQVSSIPLCIFFLCLVAQFTTLSGSYHGCVLILSFSRRVLLDRAYTDYDNIFHGLDAEMLDLPLPSSPPPPTPPPPTTTSHSPATDKFASTSETNTSDRSSSSLPPSSSPSSTDLSQILLNIKSCRWRHFRPRTLPLHELDNAHPLFRKLSRGLKRSVSASTAGGQPFGSHRPPRVLPAPAPIAGECIEHTQHGCMLSGCCNNFAFMAAWG